MKRILTLVLNALLLCGLLSPAVLATGEPVVSVDAIVDTGSGSGDHPVPDGFDYTGSVISFSAPDAFGSTFDMACGDTGFTQLHSALDSVNCYGTVEKAGTTYSLPLSVTWDFSTVDAETPGSYTAIGSIFIPEGATLADGLENTVSISVQVTAPVLAVSPVAITLTSFDEPDRTDAVAFAVGTSQEELDAWFADSIAGFTGYDADGNPYDLVSGAWSLDTVNTDTNGVCYASATPNLGTEYTLADGVSLPRQLCAVSIQTPGEPDINCCVSARGFLHFPWVLSAEQQGQLDQFSVWLRQDGGEWTSLNAGFGFTSEDFWLSQRILAYGSTYELKVTYPGGQTGVLSFQYDGELSILDYSGGDRDGGDVSGGGSGAGTQPTPTPPQTPSAAYEDDAHTSSDSTPAQGNSSSASSSPDAGQDSSSGEPQPTPAAPQAPGDSQNNENHNRDGNSPVQAPVTERPAAGTSAAPTEPMTPVYSEVAFSYETADASPKPGNQAVARLKDSSRAVLKLVAEGNHTPPEEILKSQEPTAVTESYSPAQTVISGLRLRALCADEETVVFGSGNLTVSIPSKLLLALNLTDSDTLSVRLTQPESNQILIAVAVSGKSVTELTGTVLRLRYRPQSENAEVTVRNAAGEAITDAAYDGGLLRFPADAAGTYTIVESSGAKATQKSVSPLIPVSGGLILAVGGIPFWRRMHRG